MFFQGFESITGPVQRSMLKVNGPFTYVLSLLSIKTYRLALHGVAPIIVCRPMHCSAYMNLCLGTILDAVHGKSNTMLIAHYLPQ